MSNIILLYYMQYLDVLTQGVPTDRLGSRSGYNLDPKTFFDTELKYLIINTELTIKMIK